jgi:DNA-binding CsgD family transcriptional regulator
VLALRDATQQLDDGELSEALGSGAADVADLLPELRDRLALPPSRVSTDRATTRYQLFDSVARFLLALARRRPLVLLFDNAQLADRSSLLLLEYYCRQLTSSAAMVLLAYRRGDLASEHPLSETLARCSGLVGFEQLELQGLARAEIGELLRLAAGTAVPGPIVEAVSNRSDGNPLFVTEVAAAYARRLADESRVGTALDLEVPASLRAVIETRIAALPPDTSRLLAKASILGRDFDGALLADMVARPITEVLRDLEQAASLGVLVALPPGRFRFRHALFREVLYAGHEVAQRLALHREAAAHIERRYAADPEPQLQQLAYHAFEATRGGYLPQAVEHCRRAGEQARNRRAFGEAALQFERALQVADTAGTHDLAQRFDLLMSFSDAQYRAGQVSAAAWTALRAALLAHRQRWWPRLADAVLALQHVQGQLGISHVASVPLHQAALDHLPGTEVATRARLLASMATAQRHAGQSERARELVMDSVALARDSGQHRVLLGCLSNAVYVFWKASDAPRQHELLSEALELAGQTEDEEAVLLATMSLMFPLAKLGNTVELERQLRRLTERAESGRYPHYRQVAAGFATLVALLRGRWGEALHGAQAAMREAQITGAADVEGRFGLQMFALLRATGGLESVAPLLAGLSSTDESRLWLPGKILLHCELGQFAEARTLLARCGRPDELPTDDLYETSLVLLAEACVVLRDRSRCEQLFELLGPCRGFNVSTQGAVSYGCASGYLALLAAELRRGREARALFEEALAFNARMDSPPLVARTQADFAAFLLRSAVPADRDRAADLLREARATAERLQLRPLLARIDGLAAAGAPAESLTGREIHVLRCIAAGASNRRIADELFISLSTVATHIRSILRKTGAANRTEAVALGRRSGLLPED